MEASPVFDLSPFPDEVVYVWGGREDWPDFRLTAEEQAALTGEVAEKRRVEYTRGRACAHAALAQLAASAGLMAVAPGQLARYFCADAVRGAGNDDVFHGMQCAAPGKGTQEKVRSRTRAGRPWS